MKIEEYFHEDFGFPCEHKGFILQYKIKRDVFKGNQRTGCHQDDSLHVCVHSVDCL
jgi:hypothetical protein